MKLPKVRTFIRSAAHYKTKAYFEFMLFMQNRGIDSYINSYSPLFPDYINLDLLRYLLSIGSHVACRIYCYNGFKDCILIADECGIPLYHIIKVERTSIFKIKNRFYKTGLDVLIKINLSHTKLS